MRTKIDGNYYIPLESADRATPTGCIALSAGAGYLTQLNGRQEKIIDRFFLGGDNLRGFQSGGAGPARGRRRPRSTASAAG